jgi:spore coat protein CotF
MWEVYLMGEEKNLRLTSSEIAVVWNTYQNNSFSICILKYFLDNVNDPEIKFLLQFALDISIENFNFSKEILHNDNQPMPIGFTDEDVSPSAPRLFSDSFYLYYLKNMSKVGLSVYGVALATAAHSDVRQFLSKAILTSTELYNKTAEVLLSKGLFVRAPYITTSDHIDFIDKKSYLGGLLNLNNNNRPLNAIEITHIEANVETNALGKALMAGLAQVAKSKKVRNYCTKGKDIATKHVQVFTTMLTDDDLPSPMPWDLEVTDSTVSPFSDKLIMFHTSLLIASSISNYATASAASLRTDIATSYVRLTTENAKFAKEGTDLMIKNAWLEQPPQIPNHKGLAKG